MVTLEWCGQQGRGISLIEPNENLAQEYIRNAEETLGLLGQVEGRSRMWLATMKYYCEYFAFYALMMRLGVKSEIHDCTIAVAGLLEAQGTIPAGSATRLAQDKQLRIDNQYYLKNKEVELDHAALVDFVLGMKRLTLTLTEERVSELPAQRGTREGKKMSMRIFVVVPAYNEAKKIAGVIADLRSNGYTHVVVVDDRSSDNTAAIARRHGAIVVRHMSNTGQGGALRTGIRVALERWADIIVTFDGDGQHQAKEIATLVAPVAAGTADVTLGSRFLGKAVGIQKRKWVTLKGSILVERLLLGVHLTDVHNGFRALSRHAAQTIEITCDDMAHASEIVAEIHDHRLRYAEVPVTILYDEYAKRKGQSILNSFRILKEILHMRWERKRSHPPTAG